jgi:hypothetical protein
VPREVTDPLVGMALDGKYLLLRAVGAGGFAQVYEAKHRPLGCHVAVKILQEQWRSNPHCIQKLSLEARLTSRIDHPNTVRILDFQRTGDGLWYLVMELVRGRSLRRYIEQRPLELELALRWFHQILSAIYAAHRAGVIHGDLKPSNVLIDTSGAIERVKLIDFGPSPAMRDGTQVDTVCGTPQYMAPELALGEPANEATDIYAAGVILYELLTGTVPYQGATAFDTMKQHIERPVAIAAERGAPAELSAVAQRAMAKSPADRFKTVDHMRLALMAACGQLTELGIARLDDVPALAEGSGEIVEPTNAFGLAGLERAIAKAIRSGRIRDLPRLYDRRAELLFKAGQISQAIAELEEGICVATGGEGRAIVGGPPDLWRLFYRLALLYRMTGARVLARQMATTASAHAVAASEDQQVLESLCRLMSLVSDRSELSEDTYPMASAAGG